MSMDKLIFGYSRVSSEEQAQHGISIDAQRQILEGYAAMTSQTIRIYEDAGFSGKNTDRPALRQLLADCRAGSVSAVVVWKLDRLSRSLRDTLTIIEDIFQPRNITLVSVTESIDTSTPSGRMMLNLLASFAQLEREQDSDRVVMAHKHLARDCQYLGGHVPLGYRIDQDKHYQLDPAPGRGSAPPHHIPGNDPRPGRRAGDPLPGGMVPCLRSPGSVPLRRGDLHSPPGLSAFRPRLLCRLRRPHAPQVGRKGPLRRRPALLYLPPFLLPSCASGGPAGRCVLRGRINGRIRP